MVQPMFPVSDDFPGTSIDLAKWTNRYGSWSVANNTLSLVALSTYTGLESTFHSFVGMRTFCSIEIPTYSGGGRDFLFEMVNSDYSNRLTAYWSGTSDSLKMRITRAGVQDMTSVTYDPTQMRYIQLRELDGIAFWETSPDGLTWTVRRQVTHSVDLTSMRISVSTGDWAAEGFDSLMHVKNVNVIPDPIDVEPPPEVLMPGDPYTADAMQSRVRFVIANAAHWAGTNELLVGEVGWESDSFRPAATAAESDSRWDDVGRVWYKTALNRNVVATMWAVGTWGGNGAGAYAFAPYYPSGPLNSPLDTRGPQGVVLEEFSATERLMGVSVFGAEFGSPGSGVAGSSTGTWHNQNAGSFGGNPGWDYIYEPDSTFQYLFSRGIRVVRLPFSWERVQRTLGATLYTLDIDELEAMVNRAKAAGMTRVILDMHNFGDYVLFDGTEGRRRKVGSAEVTTAHFADVWTKLSSRFMSSGLEYAIMNEPTHMPGATASDQGAFWESSAQAAVDAIRANGDTSKIWVPTVNWSHARSVNQFHPGGPWITDPSSNTGYEVHHYFHHGADGFTYDTELASAEQAGFAADPTQPVVLRFLSRSGTFA